MFGRLYCGELKKIVRPKAMIILSAVLILLLVAYAILYNVMGDLTKMLNEMIETEDGQIIPGFEQEYTFTEEGVNAEIQMLEESYKELDKEYKTEKNGYNAYKSMFSTKAQLTALKYVRDNKLYNQDVRFLGINFSIGSVTLSADGFVADYMGVVTSVMAIYAIVIGAGLLADELKNGTIKLLLTRPITKSQLVTAKLLAALTVSIGVGALFSFIGYCYGLIAFETEATLPVYLVFNASSVIRSTVGGYLFGSFVLSMFRVATMLLISYFIGTLVKKKTTAIIVTIIIHLGIISAILGMFPVQIALLVPNMSLMNYFTPDGSVPIYGNFFISLAIYIVYLAAVTFGLYFSFEKRDVI